MLNLNFLKKKRVFKKNNVLPNPSIHWIIVFCFGFVSAIFIFIFSFYLFVEVNKETLPYYPKDDRQLKKIDKKRVDQILEYFETKEKISNQILNSSAPVSDPSL